MRYASIYLGTVQLLTQRPACPTQRRETSIVKSVVLIRVPEAWPLPKYFISRPSWAAVYSEVPQATRYSNRGEGGYIAMHVLLQTLKRAVQIDKTLTGQEKKNQAKACGFLSSCLVNLVDCINRSR